MKTRKYRPRDPLPDDFIQCATCTNYFDTIEAFDAHREDESCSAISTTPKIPQRPSTPPPSVPRVQRREKMVIRGAIDLRHLTRK
jgi:hypothetical protein